MNYDLIIVTGPTATGKTNFAVNLAKKINAEIYRLFSKNNAFIGLGEIDSNNLLKAVRLISTNLN